MVRFLYLKRAEGVKGDDEGGAEMNGLRRSPVNQMLPLAAASGCSLPGNWTAAGRPGHRQIQP